MTDDLKRQFMEIAKSADMQAGQIQCTAREFADGLGIIVDWLQELQHAIIESFAETARDDEVMR